MTFPLGFKPMLSATLKNLDDAKKLRYPCYISPKVDGVRCTTNLNSIPTLRSGKVIMNSFIAEEVHKLKIPYLDFEIGLGDPTAPEFFNQTSGLIRRKYDSDFDHIDLYVFDSLYEGGYEERFINKELPTNGSDKVYVHRLMQKKVFDEDQLKAWEDYFVQKNYEGIMIRSNLASPYKFGRATNRGGELIKYKRFEDDEAVITGFVEAMQNNNEATEDAWGHTQRSSHKENKTPLGMVGVILGTCANFDGEIRIGTGIGLTHALKTDMWINPHKYLGRTFTFEYQAGTDYEKTRFGSFKGFRDDGA